MAYVDEIKCNVVCTDYKKERSIHWTGSPKNDQPNKFHSVFIRFKQKIYAQH